MQLCIYFVWIDPFSVTPSGTGAFFLQRGICQSPSTVCKDRLRDRITISDTRFEYGRVVIVVVAIVRSLLRCIVLLLLVRVVVVADHPSRRFP